jgi:deoxycytidylate deaminase
MEPYSRKRDIKILDFLSKTAEAAEETLMRTRLAAAVVIRNEIVAVGFNRRKTHPFQAKFRADDHKIYLHAETDAINRALKYCSREEFKRASLYVARVKYKDNKSKQAIWAQSMPCLGCQKAIKSYGIKAVIHTCEEGVYNII